MNDVIVLPAQQWERLSEHCSAMIAADHRGNRGPVLVHRAEHRGWLYAIFGVTYGPYTQSDKPSIDAWRLLPPEVYAGETTTAYHDEKAIRAGLRERGDHTGLIVSVDGTLMVCERRVKFLCGLPSTRPLTTAEAMAHEEKASRSGWRALWFAGVSPEFRSLGGHPVVVYQPHATLGTSSTVMLWRYDGRVAEMSIVPDVPLEEAIVESSGNHSTVGFEQMSMF